MACQPKILAVLQHRLNAYLTPLSVCRKDVSPHLTLYNAEKITIYQRNSKAGDLLYMRASFILLTSLILLGCQPLPAPQGGTATPPPQTGAEQPATEAAKAPEKAEKPKKPTLPIHGWIENVLVSDARLPMKAKLDSGAKTTSIDADILKTFEKDGKEHVLFRVTINEGEESETTEVYESEIKRWVRIKTKKGGYIRRPVIEKTICIGKQRITGEVNLAERSHFVYPLLIGRNMLQGRILVDTAKTFTSNPKCK